MSLSIIRSIGDILCPARGMRRSDARSCIAELSSSSMSGMCGSVRSSFWFADVMSGTRTTWHAYSYLWTLLVIAPLRSTFGAPASEVTKSGLSIRSVLVMFDVGKLQGRQYIPSASNGLDLSDFIVIAPFFGFVSSSTCCCCCCCGCEFPSAI